MAADRESITKIRARGLVSNCLHPTKASLLIYSKIRSNPFLALRRYEVTIPQNIYRSRRLAARRHLRKVRRRLPNLGTPNFE